MSGQLRAKNRPKNGPPHSVIPETIRDHERQSLHSKHTNRIGCKRGGGMAAVLLNDFAACKNGNCHKNLPQFQQESSKSFRRKPQVYLEILHLKWGNFLQGRMPDFVPRESSQCSFHLDLRFSSQKLSKLRQQCRTIRGDKA